MVGSIEGLKTVIRNNYKDDFKVIVIDDEVECRHEIPLVIWEEVLICFKDFPGEVWDELEQILEESHPLSLTGNSLLFSEWVQLKDILYDNYPREIEKTHRIIMEGLHPLAYLSMFLEELDVDVTYSDGQPDEKDLEKAKLIFLDYQIPPGVDGQVAINVLKSCMKLAEPCLGGVPPFIVLMSKALTKEDVAKWEGVSNKSGYFRFNYTFLEKAVIADNHVAFIVRVFDLLGRFSLSTAYYKQIKKVIERSCVASKKSAHKLFGISPTDIEVFRPVLKKDGAPLSKVLLSLYGSLLLREILSDDDTQATFASLDESVLKCDPRCCSGPMGNRLDRMLSEVLNDEKSVEKNSINFGDVFAFTADEDLFEMVISQECDLQPRSDGGIKIEKVLMVIGKKTITRESTSAGNIVYLPYWPKGKHKTIWIAWDTNQLKIRKLSSLQTNRKKRLFRMRFGEADDIQHRVASQLTRVALPLKPHRLEVVECMLQLKDEEPLAKKFSFTLVRGHKSVDKCTQIAFGPDLDMIWACSKKLKFSFDEVDRFRTLCDVSSFISMLASKNLFVLGDDFPEILYQSKTNRIPEGKNKWKP